MKTKISSLFIALILVFSTLSASATPLSISHGNGDTFYADPTGAESVFFYLDGKYIGEADSSGNLKAPSLPGGTHTLKAVAVYSDGTAAGDDIVFSSGVKAIVSEQTDNFNDLTNINHDSGTFNIGGFKATNGSKAHTFSEIRGRYSNINSNDKALQLIYTTGASGKSGMSTLDTGAGVFKNYNSGIAEIEFDIKLTNIKTGLRLQYLSTWGSDTDLLSTSMTKWPGTDCALTTDWQHVKFIINNTKKTVSFEVDGNMTDVYNSAITYTGNHSFFKIAPIPAAVPETDSACGFAIDNFYAVNYVNYAGITNATIDNGNVKLILDTPLSEAISKEKINLNTRDGQQIGVASVAFDELENALILTPSYELPKGCELDVSINSGITLTDGSITQDAMLAVVDSPSDLIDVDVDFFVNSGALLSSKQIGSGDIISVNVNAENVSSDTADFYCILTLRRDNKLVSISAEPVFISALSQKNVTLTLPTITVGGEYEVYLMTCNNLESALALSRIYKITKN